MPRRTAVCRRVSHRVIYSPDMPEMPWQCGLGLGCLASCIAIFLAALTVAWSATGRALRPVAEAGARERAFVCTASHDLVTPLMAVTANYDVLEAEAPIRPALRPGSPTSVQRRTR